MDKTCFSLHGSEVLGKQLSDEFGVFFPAQPTDGSRDPANVLFQADEAVLCMWSSPSPEMFMMGGAL